MKNCAVFLDRDGVINHEWWNHQTQAWESPIHPEDFRLREGVLESLSALRSAGYALFLVSNQPSAAKGKCTLEDLRAVHERFVAILALEGIDFEDFFYSYTHPSGVVPELAVPSPTRKPSPHFLNHAIDRFGLSRDGCWMIGDRDIDIECGKRGGVRTIQVNNSELGLRCCGLKPDYTALDLPNAVAIILACAPFGSLVSPQFPVESRR